MLWIDRHDIATEREYTPEGFLKVPARISRTGIQNYTAAELGIDDGDPTRMIRVYRPPAEVFKPESLASFAGKPVVDNHPAELLTSKTAKQFTVGMSMEDVVRDGMFAKTNIVVTDDATIKKIESGKVELSNGYTADIEMISGVTDDGDEYDAIQTNILGNHIAIVKRGRAGASCCVSDNFPEQGGNSPMNKIIIDGVTYEVSDQVAQAVGKLQKSLSDAEASKKMAEEEKDEEEAAKKKAEDEKEAMKDSHKSALADAASKVPSAEKLDKMVADRATLVADAAKVCPGLDWKGKDAHAIRSAVVADKCPDVTMDSVSEDYVTARFDHLVETAGSTGNVLDDALAKAHKVEGKDTDTRSLSDKARDKFADESRNAWKGNKSE